MRDLISFRSSNSGLSVRISNRHIQEILYKCKLAGANETGGVLVGNYAEKNSIAVIRAVGDAPTDSSYGRTWFKRGINGLVVWFEQLWKSDSCYFIGEWHFHPFSSPQPSDIDIAQLKKISKDSSWQCRTPLLLILGGNPVSGWSISVHVINRDGNAVELFEMI